MHKLFLANWKMYLSDADAEALARVFLESALATPADVAVAPSFTALDRVARVLHGSPVSLGAQDVFWTDGGAYTGEVSPRQLLDLGARYAIIGHSERRAYLGETDAMVAKKASAAQSAGLTPVICVGETMEERESGRHEARVSSQVLSACEGLPVSPDRPLVVAYEPRWAIGSGTPCRVEDVVLMHGVIRATLAGLAGEDAARSVRVLYGGSVDRSNVAEYLASPAVDGALVGGASTRPDEVRALISAFAR